MGPRSFGLPAKLSLSIPEILLLLSLIRVGHAEKFVTLHLYEKTKFEGSVTLMKINGCQNVPMFLVNKVLSVRSEHCIVMYEANDCIGQPLRLTEEIPTRHDLPALGFSLGSAEPCSTSKKSGSSQVPVPVAREYNSDEIMADADTIKGSGDGDSDEHYEDDADEYGKFKTTGRPQGRGLGGLIEETDYGESVLIDNEEDVDDFENGRRMNDYFYSTTPKPILLNETPLNRSGEQDSVSSRTHTNGESDFIVEDEVPLPLENKTESHESKARSTEFGNGTTTTTESTEEVLGKYNDNYSAPNEGLDYFGPETTYDKDYYDVSPNSSTAFPIIVPTEISGNGTTTATTTVNHENSTSATSTTVIISTTTTSTTTPPRKPPVLTPEPEDFECIISCRASGAGGYGVGWEVCAPFQGYQKCPGNSTGLVYWECLSNGTVQNAQPNFDNCTTEWIVELDRLVVDEKQDLSPAQAETILSDIFKNIKATSAPTVPGAGKTQAIYFGHEINTIVDLVDTTVLKSKAQVENVGQYENICTKSMSILDALLSQERAWEQLEQANRSAIASHLLQSVESTMFSLGRVAELRSPDKLATRYEKEFKDTPTLRLTTGVFRKRAEVAINSHTSITLPKDWEKTIDGKTIRFVGLTLDHDHASELLPPKSNKINAAKDSIVLGSDIVGFSLANELHDKALKVLFLGDGVKIKFDLVDNPSGTTRPVSKRRTHGKPICAYWDPQYLVWSTHGCKLLNSDSGTAVCECSHLTLFAILMDVHGDLVKDATLYTLTLVLCALSSVCLLVTIVVLKTFRSAKSPSTAITIQLCACLLVGNILIITVLDRNTFHLNDITCAASALTLHYVLLTAFVWMAIEGFIVRKMVVDVFKTGTEHKLILSIIAYGLPFLIVCTLGVLHFLKIQRIYGGEDYCWLQGYYILTFLGPVGLVVLANAVALGMALHVARKADKLYAEQTKKHRTWIIGTCALTSILGLTWVFGFLLLIGDAKFSSIASYIFTIFNASQGIFVFTFHCIFNRKVHTAVKHHISPKSRVSQSQTESRGVRSSTSRNDTSERRVTELTSNAPEEKQEINVHIETVDVEESEEEIEAQRRFLRSRLSSDDISQKPAFFKYLDQSETRKGNDQAFM